MHPSSGGWCGEVPRWLAQRGAEGMAVAPLISRCELLPVARAHEIHGVAEGLLRHTVGIMPPVDVSGLIAEKCAILLRSTSLEDGCEGWLDTRKRPAEIVVNTARPFHRRRFTLAHELGHFQLHDFGHVLYRDSADTVYGAHGGTGGGNREELEASEFAAALLMPRSQVAKDLEALPVDGHCWENLSRKYQVAKSAVRQRFFKIVPNACFHGEAFADSGKIICVYPSLALEGQMPGLADMAWRLNRGEKERPAFLPRNSMAVFREVLRLHQPSEYFVARRSLSVDATDWPAAIPKGLRGSLTITCATDRTVYFRFDPDV